MVGVGDGCVTLISHLLVSQCGLSLLLESIPHCIAIFIVPLAYRLHTAHFLRPWDSMVEFDDKIPQRDFDNFQFVNFTEFKAKGRGHSAAFALAALMEVPGL